MNSKKPKRPRIISFGDLTLKSSYPFIVSLFYVFRSFVFSKIKQSNSIWGRNPLFFTLLLFIGESLNGIFYLISILLSQSKLKKLNPKFGGKSKLLVLKDRKLKHQSHMIFLYIFITSLVYGVYFSVANVMTSTLDKSTDLSFEMSIFNLFFIALFSYWFLKYPIYKHHVFSCALVGLGIVLCFITRLATEKGTNFKELMINGSIYLGNFLIFSARQVFQKWLMEVKEQTPLRIIFIEAMYGICLSVIALSIFDACAVTSNSIFELFHLIFASKIGWLFLGYIIFCFLYGFFAIETKFDFSPTVMPVSFSFSIIFWKVLLLLEFQSDYYVPLYLIFGNLLLFLGCLLYNEIIIFYLCGLERDTRREIERRSLLDSETKDLSLCLN